MRKATLTTVLEHFNQSD